MRNESDLRAHSGTVRETTTSAATEPLGLILRHTNAVISGSVINASIPPVALRVAPVSLSA